MVQPQFEIVPDDAPNNPAAEPDTSKAFDLFLLLLKPLSQKAAIALASLYSLLTVGSVFWLSFVIIPHDPSIQQLVGLGGYAGFVIAVNLIVRHR